MSVLSMSNMADQQQQQQQQTLPTDQYGYSTSQPWPPLPQVSLVTVYVSVVQYSNLAVYVPISSSQFVDVLVGGADMSLHHQQQHQPLPPYLYRYSSAQPLPQLPVPPVNLFSLCVLVKLLLA